MRTVSDLPRASAERRTCLLRVDWNMESPAEAYRLTASLPTIRAILRKGYRIVILSHRDRPRGVELRYSLRRFAPLLSRKLEVRVAFVPHLPPAAIAAAVASANRRIILLENLRFHAGEQGSSPAFARALAALGDVYVNDAFSVSHRRDASVFLLPRLLPSYAGLELNREIETLSRALARSKRPLVLVVGGAKVPEKLHIIERFRREARAILAGGVAANTLLLARGADVGVSVVDRAELPRARRIVRLKNLSLPSDFMVDKGKIRDIGPLTTAQFIAALRGARTIIWNGPMGLFEDARFAAGSEAIARAIAYSKAFTITGGGETVELITRLRLRSRFGFVSTGGGAMLEFLIKGTLPGIEVLR